MLTGEEDWRSNARRAEAEREQPQIAKTWRGRCSDRSQVWLPKWPNGQELCQQAMAQKRIVFFHPDLGIGGAERLVIDAAVGLQERGHKVTIYTSYCDPGHCFDEARDGKLSSRSSHGHAEKVG